MKKWLREIIDESKEMATYKINYWTDINDTNIYFNLLNDNLTKYFNQIIIERGMKYFEDHMVYDYSRNDNGYISFVGGSNRNSEYKVVIKTNENNEIIYSSCTCPCGDHCKHICATIMQIRNDKK